jgi:hypothetical protein
MRRFWTACAIFWLSLSEATAQDRLDQAISLWLDGNDAESLPMLAEEAKGGNPTARLLLARIETHDLGLSPFRLNLGKEASRELFRAPAPLRNFAPSWLTIEAEGGSQLAKALLAAKSTTPDLLLIRELQALGEAQAADHPTRILALYGTDDQRAQLATDPALLDDLRPYLNYLSTEPEPRGDGIAALRHIVPDLAETIDATNPDSNGMAGLLALGHPFGDLSSENQWRAAVSNWVLSDPSLQPVADLCRAGCETPETQSDCAFALLAFQGGYYEAIRVDSPLETAIPQQRFLESPRARLMTLRRIALLRTEANDSWLAEDTTIRSVSECAADMIAQERAHYEPLVFN